MLAATERRPRKRLVGAPLPRIGPPQPLHHELAAFRETAEGMGITLMPWQDTAAKYITAVSRGKRHYREVCIVVARQQGKTTLMKPLIIRALRDGLRVMHIAQTRELPRHMFGVIADALSAEPDLFPKRRGKTIWPRYGAGQEEIVLANGGTYRIAAASTGGARGWTNDLVILDEIRELESSQVMDAAGPTMRMSQDPQTIYLSNAGTEKSVVLNGLRARREGDPSLAYLEWSAAPERAADDVAGWIEANPAIGHFPQVMDALERDYRAHMLSGSMAGFETESLCRWVVSMDQRLVDAALWASLTRVEEPVGRRTWLGFSMDASGDRASAVLAWQGPDESVTVEVVADVRGDPIDVPSFGNDLAKHVAALHVTESVYDPWTDEDVARYLVKPRTLYGREYVNASTTFARLVEAQQIRVIDPDDIIAADLARLSRKATQGGSFMAVRSNEGESATAALAAIRAVWLASEARRPLAVIH